jgi:hypothetical protein
LDEFVNFFKAKKVEQGFQFNSGTNNSWVSVEELRELIKEHVDPTFKL